jgi:hypothetical protein
MPYQYSSTSPVPAVLDYDEENPFWFPRFVVHGAGSHASPYMVCDGPVADCSPCSRAEKRRRLKQMLLTLKQGSQEGSIN